MRDRLREAAQALVDWYDGPPYVYLEDQMVAAIDTIRDALSTGTPEERVAASEGRSRAIVLSMEVSLTEAALRDALPSKEDDDAGDR